MAKNGFGYNPFEDMTEPEHAVADFIASRGTYWIYEHPVFVQDEKGRPRVWTPDFYMPALGIYIEVIGRENADYSYRETVYASNKIPVIFVRTSYGDWQVALLKAIVDIHDSRSKLIGKMNPF